MDRQSLRVLDFPQVQKSLELLAVTEPGRQAARKVYASTDRERIEVWLGQVTELKEYLQIGRSLPFGGIEPLGGMIMQLGQTGQLLMPDDLLLVAGTLRATANLHGLVGECKPRYHRLAELLGNLQPLPELEGKIGRAIDPRGTIRDRASPLLFQIRKEIAELRKRIHEELTETLEREASQRTLREKIINVRNDRLVIPVRSDARGAVEGIIHDTSHSGATCFVEPLSVVPLNNRLSQARSREREEETRILRELSDSVLATGDILRRNEKWLGAIDCVNAKARLSSLLSAREPQLNDGKTIRLLQATHPILVLQELAQTTGNLPASLVEMAIGADLSERVEAKNVQAVPIDLRLGGERNTLVISGANTGGKTVSLKTLGLLGTMVQAGMHIPVAEGSEWPVLNGVFAEIGDDQDVRTHLSTFSARVQRLIKVLRQVDRKSLVLLDEIGTGTDPAEGAALALAVLDELRRRGPFIAVTTHYHLIKAYGMIHDGVENVSVAFDQESGRPTYQLLYGHPGTSNALQIAADLGMPPEIIRAAKGNLDRDQGHTIDLLQQLEKASNEVKAEVDELRRQRQRLDRDQADLVREHEILVQSRDTVLNEARQKSETLLAEAENELRSVIARLQRGGMREAMTAREEVQKMRDHLGVALESRSSAGAEVKTLPAEGQQVRLRGVGSSGTLVKLKDRGRRAEVQMGQKRVEVDTEALEPAPNLQSEVDSGLFSGGIRVFREESTSCEQRLHLVGLRVEEALPLLDKAIDRAILEGRTELQIVHGYGTGRLRQAVRDFLTEHGVVKSFRSEGQGRGGGGVTLVELKD
ncbi:MAG: endonuclease MutS2 [Deltaproteobacteria bacterium]|nr:MAG: endonuclease MutS2 [Deltaproteobacteria bacterium]